MIRDIICGIVCIIGLTGLFAIEMHKKLPEDDHIASPSTIKVMNKHGVGAMECFRGICSYESGGRTIRVRGIRR